MVRRTKQERKKDHTQIQIKRRNGLEVHCGDDTEERRWTETRNPERGRLPLERAQDSERREEVNGGRQEGF